MLMEAGEPFPPFGANIAEWAMMPPMPLQPPQPQPYAAAYPPMQRQPPQQQHQHQPQPAPPRQYHHPYYGGFPSARPAGKAGMAAAAPSTAAAPAVGGKAAPQPALKEDGRVKQGETDARVGWLPGMRPAFLDKYMPQAAEKPRRAPREILVTLTEEEKAVSPCVCVCVCLRLMWLPITTTD
jgi:hypothetical protein